MDACRATQEHSHSRGCGWEPGRGSAGTPSKLPTPHARVAEPACPGGLAARSPCRPYPLHAPVCPGRSLWKAELRGGSRKGRQSNRLGRTLSDLSPPQSPRAREPIPLPARCLLPLRGCWGWGAMPAASGHPAASLQNREAARSPGASAARRPEVCSPEPAPTLRRLRPAGRRRASQPPAQRLPGAAVGPSSAPPAPPCLICITIC